MCNQLKNHLTLTCSKQAPGKGPSHPAMMNISPEIGYSTKNSLVSVPNAQQQRP